MSAGRARQSGAARRQPRARRNVLRRVAIGTLLYVTVTISLGLSTQALLTYHEDGRASLEGASVWTPNRVVWSLVGALWQENFGSRSRDHQGEPSL